MRRGTRAGMRAVLPALAAACFLTTCPVRAPAEDPPAPEPANPAEPAEPAPQPANPENPAPHPANPVNPVNPVNPANPDAPSPEAPARIVRSWDLLDRLDQEPTVVTLHGDWGYGSRWLRPLDGRVLPRPSLVETPAGAVLALADERWIHSGTDREAACRFVAGGGVLLVEEWSGDEEWLRSLAADGVVRALTAADAILAVPHALGALPPAGWDPDPTIVGVVSAGEVRVIATRQETLDAWRSDRWEDVAKFAENLARHALDVAARSRPPAQTFPIEVGDASLDGRRLRVQAVVRNDEPRAGVARVRLLPREGPAVAEASSPVAPGATANVALDVTLPVPFDVVEHRIVVSREDAVSVDRRVTSLLELTGAPEVTIAHTGRVVADVPATLRVRVRNSKTKVPIPGCRVTLGLGPRDGAASVTASAVSDAAGTTSVALFVPESIPAEAKWTVEAETPLGSERVDADTEAGRPVSIHVFPDQPIHRPGDTLRFRVLAVREATGRPVAESTIEFGLRRSADRRIGAVTVTTDERGVATGEIRIPHDAPTGDYFLVRGWRDLLVPIRIENFEVPKFRVTLESAPRSVRGGARADGIMSASRFDGAPLAGAVVSVRLLRASFAEPPVARWEGSTDARGRAAFSLAVPPDTDSGGGNWACLEVSVRDAGGRTVREARIVALLDDYDAPDVAVTDVRLSAPGRRGSVIVATGLGAGTEVVAKLDDDPPQRRTTDDHGFIAVDVPSARASMRLEVAGSVFTVGTAAGGLDIEAERRVVPQGAVVPIRVTTSAWSEAAFVDVLWNDALVATHRFRATDGIAAGEIALPDSLRGWVTLRAASAPAIVENISAQAMLFVVPRETLRVSLTPSAAETRPGATVDLDVRTTDSGGRPVPAAFALRVVDEAVLSLVPRAADVPRIAMALPDSIRRRSHATPGPELRELLETATRRDLTRGEMRLVHRAVQAEDREWHGSTSKVAESLSRHREGHVRRVDAQFAAWCEDLVRRAESVLSSGATPGPSDEVPDLVAALRVAAARGAFGRDGLTDPWGNALSFASFVPFPRDFGPGVGVVVESGFLPLAFRSPGPDGARSELRVWRSYEERFDGPTDFIDDTEFGLTMGRTLELHRAWLRAHGAEFDIEKFLRAEWEGDDWYRVRHWPHRRELAGGGGIAVSTFPDRGDLVRRYFPESLLFAPLIETDADGRARIPLKLPDSVTTWRADVVAHALGDVAGGDARIRATLPFTADSDTPPRLHSGDEVEIPVVLRWTGAARDSVVAEASVTGPLELLSPPRTTTNAGAAGEASVFVRVRGAGSGTGRLRVTCTSGAARDAIEREIAVVPAGEVISVSLPFHDRGGRATVTAQRAPGSAPSREPTGSNAPPAAGSPGVIPGSERLEVRFRGGPIDDVLRGVEGLLRQPHGCFEQASATMFPNVLALVALGDAPTVNPAVRARFVQTIEKGTSLLLSYEIPGGGFDWFGKPPAKLLLSAWGALEFGMIDRAMRDEWSRRDRADGGAGAIALRAARWVAAQQRPDGSWPADGAPYEWSGQLSGDLAATALAGRAVAFCSVGNADLGKSASLARAWVAARVGACDDPYALALAALFLAETETDEIAASAARQLGRFVQRAPGRAWLDGGRGSALYGRGAMAATEATALAAMVARRTAPDVLPYEELLAELVARRRSDGTWGTTQATVHALWALVERQDDAFPDGTEVTVRAAGLPDRTVTLQTGAPVVVDVSGLARGSGPMEVIAERIGGGPVAGSFEHSYAVPWSPDGSSGGALTVARAFPGRAAVGRAFELDIGVANPSDRRVEMPVVVVPLPAGVLVDAAVLRLRPLSEGVGRIESDAEQVTIYLRSLSPGGRTRVSIPVTPRLRGRVTAAPAEARPYYEPDAASRSGPAVIVVE